MSLGVPSNPSEPRVPKSRCWHCAGRCYHGQGAGMHSGYVAGPVRAGGLGWKDGSGELAVHILFPFSPSPSNHCSHCLVVLSTSTLHSLTVLPDVQGSTDPHKEIQCNYLSPLFLLFFPALPGPHQLMRKSGAPCHPLGTNRTRAASRCHAAFPVHCPHGRHSLLMLSTHVAGSSCMKSNRTKSRV